MIVAWGEFELDRERFELRRAGEPVRVEPRVLELLLDLAEHADRVVGKRELFERVWKAEFVGESTLTAAVAEARRALGGGDLRASPIRTVHGRGYRFILPGAPFAAPAATAAVAEPAAVQPRPAATRTLRLRQAGIALGLLAALSAAGWLLGRPWKISPAAERAAPSAEAQRLYLEARQSLQQAGCVGPAARPMLERAVALEPTFAPAWAELGWAHYNLVSSCGESGRHYDAALENAQRALALAPETPRAFGLEAVVLVETGRAEEAYQFLTDAERAGRGGGAAHVPFFQSYVLNYAGFLRRSAELVEEAVRRQPTFLADGGWTPNAYLYLGDADRFLALLPPGSSPLFRFYRGMAERRRSRPEESRRALSPAFETAPSDLFARLSQALLAALDGRPEESKILLRQLSLQRGKLGAGDGEVSYKLAQLFALVGERQEAAAQVELAVEQGFFCAACLAGEPLFADLVGEAVYRTALARARARHAAFGARFGLAD